MNLNLNPMIACDFYKVGHKDMYPQGTQMVYSNFTPRSDRLAIKSSKYDGKLVFFGLQGFIKWFLLDAFNEGFFKQPRKKVVAEYKRIMDNSLGEGAIDVKHIEALHKLGYLPLEIMALPEGSLVPMKVPVLTIRNTLPEFFWLVNYLETIISAELWKSCTSASTARQYRKIFEGAAIETGAPLEFVDWQGHDFSFRGLSGWHDSATTGSGHLTSFLGTDTIPAIDYIEKTYGGLNTFVGGSVPATEHSVMCMGGKEDEIETFRRLINQYDSGIISIVSDTWDFWKVITEFTVTLKEDILARKPNALGIGKVVFRPDSGDPVKILTGLEQDVEFRRKDGVAYPLEAWNGAAFVGGYDPIPEHVVKGAVECLWDVFGGTLTDKGFKVLNERVGLIYGDSITLERAERILSRLKDKGFASCNVVFGIGSFTYNYTTRDAYGFAVKATYGVVDGVGREVFKDPVTDSGTKKSARGLLRVDNVDGELVLTDGLTDLNETLGGVLQPVFVDGKLMNEQTIDGIRSRIRLG